MHDANLLLDEEPIETTLKTSNYIRLYIYAALPINPKTMAASKPPSERTDEQPKRWIYFDGFPPLSVCVECECRNGIRERTVQFQFDLIWFDYGFIQITNKRLNSHKNDTLNWAWRVSREFAVGRTKSHTKHAAHIGFWSNWQQTNQTANRQMQQLATPVCYFISNRIWMCNGRICVKMN